MNKLFIGKFIALLSFSLVLGSLFATKDNYFKADAYSSSSLPTTIDLNDNSESEIRNYYSSLNSLSASERQGDNLLKNLKNILKAGQKYYSYDSGTAIWQMYEISDRDWEKSPASEISGYNTSTNTINGYSYGKSVNGDKGTNPYIHALYVNRDVDNQVRAWDDHLQTQWGINREHIWPKSQGFEAEGAGGARGDPMHLWPGNGHVNNMHSNYFYGFVDTSKSYTDPSISKGYTNLANNLLGTSLTLGSGTVFEPQDCDKGDIARAVFYMVARYNYISGSDSDGIDQNNPNLELVQSNEVLASYTSSVTNTGKLGILTDLLEWNRMDPPDEFEIHRNNLLYNNYTNNRNPFIDFPEWAEYIWGSTDYDGTTFISYDESPTGYADPNSDSINGFGKSIGVSISDINLELTIGETATLTATSSDASTISWSTNNSNVVSISTTTGNSITISALSIGNATITASVTIDGVQYTNECHVIVKDKTQTTNIIDVLTAKSFNAESSYSNVSYTSDITNVTYEGHLMKKSGTDSTIQMRTTNNNSGIVSTTSGGLLESISVEWNSGTSSGRTLDIYGSNTPYTSANDLYDSAKQGTKIGSIVCGTSTSLTFDSDYEYIGIRSYKDPLYLDNITITYKSSLSSNEITSISASVNKNYYVGETINKTDISVIDNNGNPISDFIFDEDGYQFTYLDAPSGGLSAFKSFVIAYQNLTTTLNVPISRKAYQSLTTTDTTLSTDEFNSSDVSKSSSTPSNENVTIGGIDFCISSNAYIYDSKYLSFGNNEGYIYNKYPFIEDIINLNYEVNNSYNTRTDGIVYISKDGNSWVKYTQALAASGGYKYFKIAYESTSSSFSNISSISFTLKDVETALNVSNYIMYEDTNNQCTSKLDIAITYFNNMSKDERLLFMTSNDYVISTARERLEAWAINQGKQIIYTNDAYVIESVKNALTVFDKTTKHSIYLVAIISALSILSITSYLIYKKKKEQ